MILGLCFLNVFLCFSFFSSFFSIVNVIKWKNPIALSQLHMYLEMYVEP